MCKRGLGDPRRQVAGGRGARQATWCTTGLQAIWLSSVVVWCQGMLMMDCRLSRPNSWQWNLSCDLTSLQGC